MRDQWRAYQARMGFTDNEMAAFIGAKREAYRSYKRENAPTSASMLTVIRYADRMMVSLDWLAGRDVPMWSEPLFAPIRVALVAALEAHRPDTLLYRERFGHVLLALHRIDPHKFDVLFLAGLFQLSRETIEQALKGVPKTVSDEETATIVSERFGVNLEWMYTGAGPIALA